MPTEFEERPWPQGRSDVELREQAAIHGCAVGQSKAQCWGCKAEAELKRREGERPHE